MTPTLEEVTAVAWEVRESSPFGAPQTEVTLTTSQLQSFVKYWMNVQRESDAMLCKQLAERALDTHSKTRNVAYLHKQAALCDAESAIRDNTGD